jgi:hypothetical protein
MFIKVRRILIRNVCILWILRLEMLLKKMNVYFKFTVGCKKKLEMKIFLICTYKFGFVHLSIN